MSGIPKSPPILADRPAAAGQPGALEPGAAARGAAGARHAALLPAPAAREPARRAGGQRRAAAPLVRRAGRADRLHRPAGQHDRGAARPAQGLLGAGHARQSGRPRSGRGAGAGAGRLAADQVALQRLLPLRPAPADARRRPRPVGAVRRIRPRRGADLHGRRLLQRHPAVPGGRRHRRLQRGAPPHGPEYAASRCAMVVTTDEVLE